MISLCYGLPGYGKSLLIHDWLRTSPGYRYFVVEHSDEWRQGAAHWRRASPKIFDVWDARPVFEKMRAGELPETGIFRCIGMDPWVVCRLAIACGPAVYVDDEIDIAGRQELWAKHENPLKEFVHRGRHLVNALGQVVEGHIIGACRRPQNIAKDLTDLSDQTFVFRLKGDVTRSRLERDNTIESHDWDRVRTLPKFKFLHAPSGQWGSISPL